MSAYQLKTVAVDDDGLQLEIIADFVRKTASLELIGAYSDPMTAKEVISNEQPDLLLLDVEMPGLTGIELLQSLTPRPLAILITGKENYAAKAYELDVEDYLVKPVIEYDRFLKAINKAAENFIPKNKVIGDSIYVKDGSILVGIKVKDILYFEAFGDYVKIGTLQRVYVIHSTLSKIESRLPDDFFKVHRTFIVRLSEIANIDQNSLQIGEKIIPVSQSMKPKLLKKIETF